MHILTEFAASQFRWRPLKRISWLIATLDNAYRMVDTLEDEIERLVKLNDMLAVEAGLGTDDWFTRWEQEQR
jgi:hypothetical protein